METHADTKKTKAKGKAKKPASKKTPAKAKGRALTLTVDGDGIAWLEIDVPGEAQNTLNPRFGPELDEALGRLETDAEIKAAVIASGKKESFVAGADITVLKGVTSADDAEALARQLQHAFNRLENLRIPTVAAIRGACLGGGLELALACRARVCADDDKTVLGLPEVKLGLFPGAGGTQRLPRLIGIANALDLILTGKNVRPAKARKLGLVDEVCPAALVRDVAGDIARKLAAGEKLARERAPGLKERLSTDEVKDLLLEDNPVGRRLLFKKARDNVLARTGGHYPAPLRALEAVRIGVEKGFDAGLEAEAHLFGECAVTPVARSLMALFFATVELKKDNGTGDPKVEPVVVRKLGVLGGGLMGAGISYVAAANADLRVRIKEKDDAGAARALSYVKGVLDERVERRRLSPREAQKQLDRVSVGLDYAGFQGADLIIEAVFEDLELKQAILKDVEKVARKDCIFASNTSTIPIREIARASRRPETVCGMHFFSPVHKMPLLEVIVTEKTAPWVTATAVDVGRKLGKTVIVVNDGPGFYTSRILGPYMNEAAHLLAEGVPMEVIDKALEDWGFPVGPVTLLDEVGIDVAEKAGKVMHAAFAERVAPPDVIRKLVGDGRLGKKNKKGFYKYGDRKKKGKKEPDETVYKVLGVTPQKRYPPLHDIAERVALTMVNEAALCLGEGILRSVRDGDIGAIFGLGFPPFRGGPFRWIDQEGAASVVAKLEKLRDAHGPRFEPAPILLEHARSGDLFHAG